MPSHKVGFVHPDHPNRIANTPFTLSSELKNKGKSAMADPKTGITPTDLEISGALILGAAATPSVINQATPTPQDQIRGECVAFTEVLAMRSIEQFYATGATSYSFTTNVFSQAFVYNQVKFSTCDAGTAMQTVLDFMVSVGCCLYNTMPYTGDCSVLPNAVQLNEAAKYKVGSYSKVLFTDRAAIKTLVSQNHPISVAILADNNFVAAGPGFIWSAANHTTGTLPHNVAIVGYDDAKNAYKVMNSWGTDWCDSGFGYIDYDFFETGNVVGNYVYYITSLNNVGTGNTPPIVNAGADQTITLPTSQVTLVGTVTLT